MMRQSVHLLRRRRCVRSFSSVGESGAFNSSTTPPPSDAASSNSTPRKLFRYLKFGFFGALARVLGTSGYATYAYTADEVDDKIKAFGLSINHNMVDNAPTYQKFQPLYSTVMTVPVKAANLYLSLRRLVEEHVQELAEPTSDKLLPDMDSSLQQMGVLTLVLDLRETLIHTEWKREIGLSTFKRPGLDDFLVQMSRLYEIIVYTDDMHLDYRLPKKLAQRGVMYMLTRPQTKYQDGKHYRDLSKLNRDPSKILYVSGHAFETCLQHENCVPIKPWRKEAYDTTLMDLIPFLEYVGLQRPVDIRRVLASFHGKDIPSEFIRRSEEYQRTLLEKQQRGPIWRRNMVRPSSGHVG